MRKFEVWHKILGNKSRLKRYEGEAFYLRFRVIFFGTVLVLLAFEWSFVVLSRLG